MRYLNSILRDYRIWLIAGIFVASSSAHSNQLVLISNDAGVDKTLREDIKKFEEVCIPFALHETELSRKEDMAHNKKAMIEREFFPYRRSRNCMRSHDEYWHPSQEFKSNDLTLGSFEFIWPQERNIETIPGGSCSYRFAAKDEEIVALSKALVQYDGRWVDPQRKHEDSGFSVFSSDKLLLINDYVLKLKLFDDDSQLNFSLIQAKNYVPETRSYEGNLAILKVKGENNDAAWAPFMPNKCL